MISKRARLTILVGCIAITTLFVLAKCVPDVSADTIGPPTVETLLQNINSNIIMSQWAMGIICALLIYIYKSGNRAIMREVKYVDGKAQVAIEKADELETKFDNEKDRVNRDFMTVQAHKQICGSSNGHH